VIFATTIRARNMYKASMIVKFPVGVLYNFSKMLLVLLFRIVSCFRDSSLLFFIHTIVSAIIITAPKMMTNILVDSENISFEDSLVT
jgi:hypothetical protein